MPQPAGDERSANRLALQIERAICRGESNLVMLEQAKLRAREDLDAAVALSLGRAAEDEQDFAEARRLFERAVNADEAEIRARAEAHLAYLDYYAGRCEPGLARARAAARSVHGLAAGEAHLYASVNAVALNRALDALEEAHTARNFAERVRDRELRHDLRFRIARQLVHVLVEYGDYSAAAAEAETASAIARATGSARHLGLAAYLRGHVCAARGDPVALTFFREADRHWGGSSRSFGRWLQYVWAVTLRNLGNISGAQNLRLASGIKVPWEEPLFDLAEGSPATPPDAVNCPSEDVPFRQAARGIVFYAQGRLEDAARELRPAIREFERCDFHHERRGASLALAATLLAAGDLPAAEAIVRDEVRSLVRHEIRTWPWWYRPAAIRVARFAVTIGVAPGYWRQMLQSADQAESDLADVLRARDLTERQIEVVRSWLAEPQLSRVELGDKLGVSEASVRAHLNVARRKLGCDGRRGAEALRDRIAALAGTYRVN
jgi:DNA-binding CsgD family transcriptional regulator